MTITPWDHQIEIAPLVVAKLKEYGICYVAMEERTGKSIILLLACEQLDKVQRVLIITKKKALGDADNKGWKYLLAAWKTKKTFHVTNYHSAHKVTEEYDLYIFDEAHAYISGYPKPSKMWNDLYKKVYGKPILFASATPYAQGPQLLFHQLKMSKWSPWRQFKDFYDWFKEYAERDKHGHLQVIRIGAYQTAIDYTKVAAAKAIADVEHIFITKTRKELGFEHEPDDVLHYIELQDSTRDVYNTLIKHDYLEFSHSRTNRDYTLVCDSPIKLRSALHMLEGGVLKVDENYLDLGNDEKADYVLKTWGDVPSLVIMYFYKADKIKLERKFKHAKLLQATSYAEGIDLSMYADLVIYSQDFSTSKHTQRRARQANKERKTEIKVHFLLVKKATSEQIYNTVSINKTNFVDSVFERNII